MTDISCQHLDKFEEDFLGVGKNEHNLQTVCKQETVFSVDIKDIFYLYFCTVFYIYIKVCKNYLSNGLCLALSKLDILGL